MPGIYKRPPRRPEFAADLKCALEAAEALLAEGDMRGVEVYVHSVADAVAAERLEARAEAAREWAGEVEEKGNKEEKESKKEKEKELNAKNNPIQRFKFQQELARKESQVAEAFFDCGVHTLYCRILQQPRGVSAGAIERILNVRKQKRR